MTIHVPLGLCLSVGAAVALVTGSVAVVLGRAAAGDARTRVAGGLTAWLAVDVTLGAAGVFATSFHRPVPVLAAGIAVPVAGGVWLLRRHGEVRRLVDSIPLRSLVAVQTYRVAGVVFILAWADGRIPGAFALPAGLGDIAVGLSAPFVARRVDDGSERSRRTAIAWNVAGIADLVVAVTLGALTSPTPLWPVAFGGPNQLISRLPFVLIPVFAVPLSALLHYAALGRLTEPAGSVSGDPPDHRGIVVRAPDRAASAGNLDRPATSGGPR
jgi:hypothetical protein